MLTLQIRLVSVEFWNFKSRQRRHIFHLSLEMWLFHSHLDDIPLGRIERSWNERKKREQRLEQWFFIPKCDRQHEKPICALSFTLRIGVNSMKKIDCKKNFERKTHQQQNWQQMHEMIFYLNIGLLFSDLFCPFNVTHSVSYWFIHVDRVCNDESYLHSILSRIRALTHYQMASNLASNRFTTIEQTPANMWNKFLEKKLAQIEW